jgi:hypothetical protein
MPAARRASKTTKTTGRKTTTKAARKTASKTKAKTTAKATSNGYKPINVQAIVKRLRKGETMTVIRSEYGPGPKIREALWSEGYNTLGEDIEVPTLTGKGAALAKKINAARGDRRSWTWIKVATGLSEAEARQLCEEHGYTDYLEGRVEKDEDDVPRPRSVEVEAPAPRRAPAKTKTTRKAAPVKKSPAKAKASQARKAPAKRTAAKATTVKTGKRPGRRVRRVNP